MKLDNATIQKLARIICINDINDGKTGIVDTHILAACFKEFSYEGDDNKNTKWKRLYSCFEYFLNKNHTKIQEIIQYLMNPKLYINYTKEYKNKIIEINKILAFDGIHISEDGILRHSKAKANTINEAEERLKGLLHGLSHIDLHRDVIKYCNQEYLKDNYFHCILEASKSIYVKIKEKTNLTIDGIKLIDEAFGQDRQEFQRKPPYLAFTSLVTTSDKEDHFGFVHLMKAIGKIFRNITAHEPKRDWHEISKTEAIEALTMISYIHKRLDKAHDVSHIRAKVLSQNSIIK